MNFWPGFWMVTLIGAIGAFGLLSIVVAVGGIFDIRQMLETISEKHRLPYDKRESKKTLD